MPYRHWYDVATACHNDNPWNDASLYAFVCDGAQIGFIVPSVWTVMQRLAPEGLVMDEHARCMTFSPACASADARTRAVNALAMAMRDAGECKEALGGWRDEQYAVYGPQHGQVAFTLERAACALFGVATFGVHLTAYTPEGLIWVPKRSATKSTWPNMYDNSVAGGVTAGEQVFTTVVRECEEEASLTPELVMQHVQAAGLITYFFKTAEGYRQPEMQFIYDLCVPRDTILKPNDNEAQSFEFMDRHAVTRHILAGEFKPNCCLGMSTSLSHPVLLDFFIRHGWITPDEPDYTKLVALLHAPLGVPTP